MCFLLAHLHYKRSPTDKRLLQKVVLATIRRYASSTSGINGTADSIYPGEEVEATLEEINFQKGD